MEWIEFWPAVSRAKFWRIVTAVAMKGAIVATLVFGAITAAGVAVDKLCGVAVLGWIDSLSGAAWLALVLGFWLVGATFYAALRTWRAEVGADFEDALIALDEVSMKVAGVRLDGRIAFGTWGQHMLRPTSPTELHQHIRDQVVFQIVDDAAYVPGTVVKDSQAEAMELTARLSDIFILLEEFELATRLPGQDKTPLLSAQYELTSTGKQARRIAAKQVLREGWKFRLLRTASQP